MNLTSEDFHKYFETRLGRDMKRATVGFVAKCLFHDDRTASLSIHPSKGVWKCHAGCGEGGIIDFEVRYSKCDKSTAWANISEVLGGKQIGVFQQKPEAVYTYRDSQGRVIFEKVRYVGKRFVNRRPDGKHGWINNLEGIARKPLYNLNQVITAQEVCVCEGEKDADNLANAMATMAAESGTRLATTTNFDGAGKWRAEDAVYFAGKRVVIFPDNDDIGRRHAQQVAQSVYPLAAGVKVVNLSTIGEKGDVSDYLRDRSIDELMREVNHAQQWKPTGDSGLFIPAHKFLASCPEEIDWLVEGVIQRGANGFIAADPKAGKSWAAVDLAISLATGSSWLDFRVPSPVRVAIVSREDNPSLTQWRMRGLARGKMAVLEGNDRMYINSRQQSAEFMLDDQQQVGDLIQAMKEFRPEFAIFDVFNRIHRADENDNQEMCAVLEELSRIQREVGCAIAVVHHFNKSGEGSIIRRLRGSSAISGWAEWIVGISMHEATSKVRKMEFECKAGEYPDPIFWTIDSEDNVSHLVRKNLGETANAGAQAGRLM